MSRTCLGTLLAVTVAWFLQATFADTIYVDRGNTGGPWDGTSWATAWTNITQGAGDLAAKNGVSQGGHVVFVANAVYEEQIDLHDCHAGVSGSPNVFLSTNGAMIDGTTYCFYFSRTGVVSAAYIVIDGFNLTGSSSDGVRLWGQGFNYYNAVKNCCIYGNEGCGVYCYYRNQISMSNCTVVGNGGYGYYEGGSDGAGSGQSEIRNCIIANNGINGVLVRYTNTLVVPVLYSCIYGNGNGAIRYSNNELDLNTEAEINGFYVNSGNVVGNPGFKDMSGWNFNAFYADSPCLDAGDGGVDMGAYQDPPTSSFSTNTYYVKQAGGNDGNDGLSEGTAWATIGKAATVAEAGDTVIIKPGIYSEDVVITNSGSYSAGVTYRADGDVSIDGGTICLKLDRVSNVTMEGLKLTGATQQGSLVEYSFDNNLVDMDVCSNATYGIDFEFSSSNTISRSELYRNSDSAVKMYRCSSTVQDSRIHSNTSDGLSCSGANLRYCYNGLFSRCRFYSNTTDVVRSNESTDTDGSVFENCEFYANSEYALWIEQHTAVYVYNCLFYGNVLDGLYHYQGQCKVYNSIFVENRYGIQEGSGGVSAGYCCFTNNTTAEFRTAAGVNLFTAAQINGETGCSNNIVVDPMFRDADNRDFRLRPGSPCVDAGTPTSDYSTDLYGRPRLEGVAVDIGPYELPAAGTVMQFW